MKLFVEHKKPILMGYGSPVSMANQDVVAHGMWAEAHRAQRVLAVAQASFAHLLAQPLADVLADVGLHVAVLHVHEAAGTSIDPVSTSTAATAKDAPTAHLVWSSGRPHCKATVPAAPR